MITPRERVVAGSQIVGVISGYNNGTGDDVFGWVPKHHDTLTRETAALQSP